MYFHLQLIQLQYIHKCVSHHHQVNAMQFLLRFDSLYNKLYRVSFQGGNLSEGLVTGLAHPVSLWP